MTQGQSPPPLKPPAKPFTREERLAARLRDNLKLRKAQSRALNDAADRVPDKVEGDSQS
jgi:hypothetical protein